MHPIIAVPSPLPATSAGAGARHTCFMRRQVSVGSRLLASATSTSVTGQPLAASRSRARSTSTGSSAGRCPSGCRRRLALGCAPSGSPSDWAPGNHELWTTPSVPLTLRGEHRYRRRWGGGALGVARGGSYPVWEGPGGRSRWNRFPVVRLHVPATGIRTRRTRSRARTGGCDLHRRGCCCTPTRTRAAMPGRGPRPITDTA